MISSRFIQVSFLTMVLFLSSCGGNEQKTTTETTTTDSSGTTTTTTVTAPASTIITTPQGMLIVRHKVANFAKWKISYDAHDSLRLANGIHSYVIGRGVVDSNMVFVATKADDMAKAKAFAANPSLKEAMQKSGVTGKPTLSLATITYQDTTVIGPGIRSLTMFPVKDWDNWQKAFTEGRPERLENGVTDRAFGHDLDDNKKVVLVTALTDTAKAFAYWKSDKLKARRAASGAIGVPERVLFRIVQRY